MSISRRKYTIFATLSKHTPVSQRDIVKMYGNSLIAVNKDLQEKTFERLRWIEKRHMEERGKQEEIIKFFLIRKVI